MLAAAVAEWYRYRIVAGFVTSSSPVPLKIHRVPLKIQLCTLNLSRAETSSRRLAARGLLSTDHVTVNHGQVTWMTPELALSLLTTKPYQREDISALDRFHVHRSPTRWVFSGTGIKLMTCLP
ncbi:uncharacterized protein TNCV_3011791 [Trichonephila clavipes]|nr:uncharacterized protein TNCV_3011791 [Trichonephila clavipes]